MRAGRGSRISKGIRKRSMLRTREQAGIIGGHGEVGTTIGLLEFYIDTDGTWVKVYGTQGGMKSKNTDSRLGSF